MQGPIAFPHFFVCSIWHLGDVGRRVFNAIIVILRRRNGALVIPAAHETSELFKCSLVV